MNKVVHSNTGPEAGAWHALDVKSLSEKLGSDPIKGLDEEEARGRLESYGPNALKAAAMTPWYGVLLRQFTNVLIIILLLAAAISLAIGEVADSITILVIVVFNGVLGFVQEWKAERAMEALQKMLSPRCRVVRGGREREIEAAEVVPGDVAVLEIGYRVPADLRLIEVLNLKVDESSLTGESESVGKDIKSAPPEAPLAERRSMAWMGTVVTNGRGLGVVVATGMATEFGRIAHLTQSLGEERTPLQRKLAVLGSQLGLFSIAISVIVALSGFLLGKPLVEMFLTGVSLAVAVVPEGLPAVVTITLALGVRAMVQKKALLRRLQGAETLGAATVICSDKTGTLTRNEMTVQRVWLPAGEMRVTGIGYDPAGHFEVNGEKIDYGKRGDLIALLHGGLICSHARLNKDEEGWHALGEPTETALVVAAFKARLYPEGSAQRVSEFSFSSLRKRMTVIERREQGLTAFVKGAPEVILKRCTRILDGNEEREMTAVEKKAATAAYEAMAGEGLRTLSIARRVLPDGLSLNEESVEKGLTLLGIVGIIDPPRAEVSDAIKTARNAGIQTLMITGDSPKTALAIARRIGLRAERAYTGSDIDAMDDEALRKALSEEAVFARTTPEHKIRIVTVLQGEGNIVGMTGDGVNDAPALKKADIGIAMGIRGTDVAKGASDMILTDDNFASIIGAVEEGRRQYDNIQKFVRYLLSSNTGEVAAIFVNILLGGPLILVPVQILWMNLVTDGMTAVALGLEPAEKGLMDRPPRAAREPVLDKKGLFMILLLGGYIGAGCLWLFHHYLAIGHENAVGTAETVAFTGIILLEKMNVFNFRALREPLHIIGFFSNPWIIGAWVVTVGLQVCAVYVPFLQNALHTVPLGLKDWGLMLLVAAPVLILSEGYKWRCRKALP
ncbi:MAG: cation-translocating P-type ATPase [Thermodesulfobacteriota bacterium]